MSDHDPPRDARDAEACAAAEDSEGSPATDPSAASVATEEAARFRAMAELVPDLLWEEDADGQHVWANRRWTEYTGQSDEDARGQGWLDVVHPDDREMVLRDWREAVEAGTAYRSQYRLRRSDGEYRWYLVESVPIRNEAGEIVRWMGASTDVHEERTSRDRLEELVERRTRSLAESERRYRALVTTSADIVWSTDANGLTVEDSPTWRAYTWQSFTEYQGVGWQDAVHPDDRAETAAAWRESVEKKQPYVHEHRLWHGPSRTWRWTQARSVPLRDPEDRLYGWFGTNTDVHERKQAQDKLREMARRLTMAEQEERRRLSQILHDDLQQILYSVEMKLDSASRRLAAGETDEATPALEDARNWIKQAVTTTRQLTTDLSPMILQGEGLVDAVAWLRSQLRELHGMDIALEATRPWQIEDEDLRVLLFQVVRELLLNVHQHAGTGEALVRFEEREGRLVIHVIDRGRGFDPSGMPAESRAPEERPGSAGRGAGLVRARERLALLGGSLEVRSEPGRGTHAEVHAPVGSLP